MKNKLYIFIINILPKKIGHKIIYYKYLHKKLNLNNPLSLNEKVHWLSINYYGKKEGLLSDKQNVKEYINKLNIKDLHIPKTYYLISSKKDKEEVLKNNLPNKFVIKTNHGAGDVFICNNNSKEDIEIFIDKELKLLKKDYSKKYLEYHYSFIKPVVMIEEYLDDKKNFTPTDYKFFCFDGYVDCVMICSDRSNKNYRDFYDKNWNHLNYSIKSRQSKIKIKKPKSIVKMFKIASIISKGFPLVKVDLYNINGKIYFGELTFTPAAGIADHYSEEGNIHLGKLININKLK